ESCLNRLLSRRRTRSRTSVSFWVQPRREPSDQKSHDMRSFIMNRVPAAPADIFALAAIAVLSVVASITFLDYGLGWDDYAHSHYGELLYAYYTSGFADKRAFEFSNLFYYGGGFDLA